MSYFKRSEAHTEGESNTLFGHEALQTVKVKGQLICQQQEDRKPENKHPCQFVVVHTCCYKLSKT